MTVRWRLGVTAIQLTILAVGSFLATGRPYSEQTWFTAGLLAIVINRQLLEPFYHRPGDVVANCLIALVLYLTTQKVIAVPAWNAFALLSGLLLVFGVVALLVGRENTRLGPLGRATWILIQPASSQRIYSCLFWLALFEFDPALGSRFWTLTIAWFATIAVSSVRWDEVFGILTGRRFLTHVVGMIGPTKLLVASPHLPTPGTVVDVLTASGPPVSAVVLARVWRGSDAFGQLLMADQEGCERCATSEFLSISVSRRPSNTIGTVESGSSDYRLRFIATRPLEIGTVVSVVAPPGPDVLYQLAEARVIEITSQRDAQLAVQVDAMQIGRFVEAQSRLQRTRWVPEPGAPVVIIDSEPREALVSSNQLELGNVLGTSIPILLDCDAACEGHLAILGMTKMGKTSLAIRLAKLLSAKYRVVVLDQTGEYVRKRGLPKYDKDGDWTQPGLSILEPRASDVLPEFATKFMDKLVQAAVAEYQSGNPPRRVVIVDEAHQFIPEPAGLGFQTPGREHAYKFGSLMMQIRKYGITVILISQRTAVVAKSALSQCENVFAFRSVDQTGLDYLEAIAGTGVRALLPQLRHGEALVFGPAVSADGPVAIKVQHDA